MSVLHRSLQSDGTESQGRRTVPAHAACDRSRTLIVDDDDAIVRLFRIFISSAMPDLRVDTASTGSEALQVFTEGHHALLLVDLHMPEMDGATAVRKIRGICEERKWDTPSVVFCTGCPMPDISTEAKGQAWGNALLMKPVTCEGMVSVVKRLLS